MDRLNAMQIFVGVFDAGSFTAAADHLGISRAAVSKSIQGLEDYLGARLFNRTTRRVSPTEIGLAYYDRAVNILADLDEAEREAARLQTEPTGMLKINAPMSLGTMHLAPAIADFMAMHRELNIQMVLNDRYVDMIEEGFDISVRVGELEDSSLMARRIAPSRMVVCAAPAYLRDNGSPEHPEDLANHCCLHYGYLASGSRWILDGAEGPISVQVNGVLCANNGELLAQAAVRGLGIAMLPAFIVGRDMQAGSLVSILPGYPPPTTAINAVYPPNRQLSAKVRLFIDFLVERFGPAPYWDLVG